MSSDNTQRQIDFIIEQQARFSEDLARLEQQTSRNTESIGNMVDALLSLTRIVEQQADQIGVLIEQGRETDRRLKETDQKMKDTDGRLNALINVVERYISGQNGK
ncbi:MAG TPA: hypothetical protein VLD57_03585 [Blastocatellia bacterium]|nr:hypothetical protein [Blastocatellia bacterium]